jgi:hypothetical protein
MFAKEIILKEQLAARYLLQCSPARKLRATLARWIIEGLPVIRQKLTHSERETSQKPTSCRE